MMMNGSSIMKGGGGAKASAAADTTSRCDSQCQSLAMNSTRGGAASADGGGSVSLTSGGTGTSQSNKSKPMNMRTDKRIHYIRVIFLLALLGVAAGLGYGAYKLIKEGESSTAQERFDSVSERALSIAQTTLEEKKLATDTLAYVAASENPTADKWPFVYLEGYEEIATTLSEITERQSLSFCPIVIPGGSEQIQFEEFAYNLYSERNLPNNSGVSMFGKGIFAYDFSENAQYDDKRRHEVSNYTYYGSERNILLPFLQSNLGYHSALMLNVHFEQERGIRIDQALDCGDLRRESTQDYNMECGTLSDLFWTPTNQDGVDPGPGLLVFSPIYPKYNNMTITGFIVAKTIMHDMLQHGFASDVNGLHAVITIRPSNKQFTYEILGGQAYFIGDGDLHSPHALYHQGSMINPNYFSTTSPSYYLDLYSTQAFVEEYSTDNPKIACFGAVMIIVFTSILFLGYDFFVRKEFSSKKSLLESKRQFVRFVSHEVRTPLNTVCMGLTLMQDDFSKCLGLGHHAHHAHNHAGGDQGQGQQQKKNGKNGGDEPTTATFTSSSTGSNSSSSSSNHRPYDMEQVEDWMQLSAQIQSNAEAAVSVLNDLLNYDKIQMGNLTLELSLIPVWSIIQKTVSEFQIASLEKHVKLAIDFTPLLLLDDGEEGGATASSNNDPSEEDMMGRSVLKQLNQEKKGYKIVADNIRIAQVLRNLISNGLKFSSENGALTVRVSHQLPKKSFKKRKAKKNGAATTTANGNDVYETTIELSSGDGSGENNIALLSKQGNVVIDVIDDGIGMTPDQVKTVFNDGTQFNANKLQAGGGSGLGLNIAKGIANEHGGSLKCHSAGIGKGTTFTLTIPVYKMMMNDHQARGQNHQQAFSSSAEESTSKEAYSNTGGDSNVEGGQSPSQQDYVAQEDFQIEPLDILVVDDSATNRKLCMRLLEKQGHKCDGANDGKEAVEMAKASLKRNEPYDCILMDYEMPNMIGPEACKRIREMGCWSYIVGVTGNVMGEDVARFRECGANWVLPKPFKLESLEQKWIEDGVSPRRKDPDDSGRFQLLPAEELDAGTSERLHLPTMAMNVVNGSPSSSSSSPPPRSPTGKNMATASPNGDNISSPGQMKRIDSTGHVLELI